MNYLSPHCFWIEDLRPKFPHLADKAMAAYAIFERGRTGALDPQELRQLEDLCHERSKILREWAASIIGSLTEFHVSAAELLFSLVRSPRADVAISSLVALHDFEDKNLKVGIVRLALLHKARRVRELAASKALKFGLSEVLSDLESARQRERDEHFIGELNFHIGLIRDGFFVKYLEDGGVDISVLGKGSLAGRLYSKEMLVDKGIESLIAEMRSCLKF